MALPRHIVCVTGFVRDEAGRILMIRSPKRGWELPGGTVEEAETLPAALSREVLEETGIEVRADRLAGIYTVTQKSALIFTFVATPLGGSIRTSPESLEVDWLPLAEAEQRATWPSMKMRLTDLGSFDGKIQYRSYRTDPFDVITEASL